MRQVVCEAPADVHNCESEAVTACASVIEELASAMFITPHNPDDTTLAVLHYFV